MILTATKAAAATINRIAVHNLFPGVHPCGEIKYDGTDTLQPLYHGTKVIIMQYRDKALHIVNGQTATVQTMQNQTVFLKLPSESIFAVYQVTDRIEGQRRT